MTDSLRTVLLCISIGVAGNVHAETPTEFILLPIATQDTTGAFGSLFRTEFMAFNDSSRLVFLMLLKSPVCRNNCVGNVSPRQTLYTDSLYLTPPGGNPGVLLVTEKETSDLLRFNLRVRDLSRQAQTWGTEIPVVRERDAFTTTAQILNVPTDDRFRQTLRIYSFNGEQPADVRLRIYRTDREAPPLVEEVVHLSISKTVPGYEPAYAQISWLVSRFPQIAATPTVRVEVTAITPLLRFWPFVTVTNNETQHITTISPD